MINDVDRFERDGSHGRFGLRLNLEVWTRSLGGMMIQRYKVHDDPRLVPYQRKKGLGPR